MEDYRKYYFKTVKRDRLEIVSAIIAITQQPSNFTGMMGHANLSYSRLKEYLRLMIGSCLIEKRELAKGAKKSTLVYQATEKGNRFLELYCGNLMLLHGEHFLENNGNLADAYLLQYCRKNKLTLGSKLQKSVDKKIKTTSET